MIETPTDEEKRLLGVWKYTDGLVIVHTDKSHYPPEDLWGMYSYLFSDEGGDLSLCVNAHYRFQKGVPDNSNYIGIQHPNVAIDKDKIEFERVFRTPLYDLNSTPIIKELSSLNGNMNSYFCGSHFGYGLHEDAVTSAINVGKMLGAQWK
jgi:predicted NAD/FAD-binding protein